MKVRKNNDKVFPWSIEDDEGGEPARFVEQADALRYIKLLAAANQPSQTNGT